MTPKEALNRLPELAEALDNISAELADIAESLPDSYPMPKAVTQGLMLTLDTRTIPHLRAAETSLALSLHGKQS